MKANKLRIRKILATNCKETIEAELEIKEGVFRFSVPMGTSVGKYEVKFLPVDTVIKNFSKIKKHFVKKEFDSQEEVDQKLKELDGTKNFSKIGGNLCLAISSVFFKAFARNRLKAKIKKMPKPLCNVAGGWGKESEIQEFLLLPKKQKSYREEVFKIAQAYLDLGNMLKQEDESFKYSRNYESGWVTNLWTDRILELLLDLCKQYKLKIGLDVAASDRWDGKTYVGNRTTEEQFEFISGLIRRFGITFVEDPFHEDDFDSFARLTKRFKNILICGDDLFATNLERLKIGIKKQATNTVLIKPNQIGTITDTINFIKLAKKNKMKTVMSHRSGTTDETFLCHLAIMLGCDYVKFGISGERIVKINEIIRIEEKLT